MNEEYLREYIPKIAMIFLEKIYQLKDVDFEKVDKNTINEIVIKAAYDFLVLNYEFYKDYGDDDFCKIDKYSLDQISNSGWKVGSMQIEGKFLCCRFDVMRFNDDLSDLTFSIVGDGDNEVIVATERKDSSEVYIRSEDRELRLQDGQFKFRSGKTTLTYDKIPTKNLSKLIAYFREGKFDKDLTNTNEITGPSLDDDDAK